MVFSPLRTSIFYFILGVLFTYLAINSITDSTWTFFTYMFVIFATFDFGVSIRAFNLYLRIKASQRK